MACLTAGHLGYHLIMLRYIFSIAVTALLIQGCDSGLNGESFENLPPDTHLSVRDSDLSDNLDENARLTSTVLVSWSGDDPDGFVTNFDVRFYDQSDTPPTENLWTRTARTDSLILLPIPQGEKSANVVFEVRAIDNEGKSDPSPAITVFPIKNAPPEFKFSQFELPPDTTFGVFSFAWIATDPEGQANLDRIEIAFNDTLNFVALSPDIEFVTFVADVNRQDPNETTVQARVFEGKGFASTDTFVPNLKLDEVNTLYARSVDATDTTSTRSSFSWFVKGSRSNILVVNDYRKDSSPTILSYHLDVLRQYLPESTPVDIWTITTPFFQGSAGNVPKSNLLPAIADPTLTHWLEDYSHIYWISTNTTNSIASNNLPFVAPVLDRFFDSGGTMIVHSPVSLPANPEDNLGNPSLLLLPIDGLITFPDSLRPQLRQSPGSLVRPTSSVPGTSEQLPELETASFAIGNLPYDATGPNTVPLMDAEFTYVTRASNTGPWTGTSTVASMSVDQRVGLFALPLVNEQSGDILFVGADGNPDGAKDAIHLMLRGLNFPSR